jgi:VanZ family protein
MAPAHAPHSHSLYQGLCRSLAGGRKARRAWLIVLWLLIATVAWLATMPQPPAQMTFGWDKLNHALAFAALALAAGLAHPHPPRLRLAAWAALLAYGALIEASQSLVPPRSAEWGDRLADAVGIGIGAAIATAVSNTANTAQAFAANRPRR